MFSGIGRRLAFLNALVVVAILALVGAVTYFALRTSLNNEIDNELEARIETVQHADLIPQADNSNSNGRDDDEDDDHHDEEEILASGDTIVFVVDTAGQLIYNPRDIRLPGVPVPAGIDRALKGESDTRSVTIHEIGSMRVMSEPVTDQDRVVGAVQAMRSLREHERELDLLMWMTLLGVGLGALVAIPAGLFLARRAMRPINATFERQRTFIADVSHELRTPLALIRANAEFALREPEADVESIRPELTGVLEEIDRTDRLVDDLLILARADAGRLQLLRGEWDLSEVLHDTLESMRPLAGERSATLEQGELTPCTALVDRDRIIQLLRIVLDNAIKHTPEGGSVQATLQCVGDEAMITVQDSGSGISPEDLPRVFDRFYRVDQARSRQAGGTGLGLAIAKAITETHGGRIEIASRPGSGTAVTITLPRT